MQTTAKKVRKAKKAAGNQQPPVFYRLHALLHTIRAIEGYEDQLCTLLHDIKSTGEVNTTVQQELLDLLEEMPTEYQDELNAIRRELTLAASPA